MGTRRKITLYVICRYCWYIVSCVTVCEHLVASQTTEFVLCKSNDRNAQCSTPHILGSSWNSQLQCAVQNSALFVCHVLLWLTNCN